MHFGLRVDDLPIACSNIILCLGFERKAPPSGTGIPVLLVVSLNRSLGVQFSTFHFEKPVALRPVIFPQSAFISAPLRMHIKGVRR